MVHSGILRAFGADLRRVLGMALATASAAFCAGVGRHRVLQSSTATALMTTPFAAAGWSALVPALADHARRQYRHHADCAGLPSTSPCSRRFCSIIGVVAFKRGARTRTRDLGRVAIGLGLMLLALHILLDTLAPAENAPGVRGLLAAMTGSRCSTCSSARPLAWAAHSSVAVVLSGDVAGLFEFHYAGGRARPGARRQSRQRHQSAARGRRSRQSDARRLPLGNLDQPRLRLRPGPALPAADRRSFSVASIPIRRGWSPISIPLFNLALAAIFIMPAAGLRQAARVALAGRRPQPPIRRRRSISMSPRSARRRWRSPARRAKPCTWATSSRPCCARPWWR